jgi:hypothetical protein
MILSKALNIPSPQEKANEQSGSGNREPVLSGNGHGQNQMRIIDG